MIGLRINSSQVYSPSACIAPELSLPRLQNLPNSDRRHSFSYCSKSAEPLSTLDLKESV